MESGEDSIFGIKTKTFTILVVLFMATSCIFTLVFGPEVITDPEYSKYMEYMRSKTMWVHLKYMAEVVGAYSVLTILGTLIPMGIIVIINVLRGKKF